MTKSGSRPAAARWAVWLSLGVLAGVALGFAAGLIRPRAQTPRIET